MPTMPSTEPVVKIQFGRARCKFLTPYPSALNKALAVYYPGYIFSPRYKKKQWDGKYHFVAKDKSFPTGLLPFIYYILVIGSNPLEKPNKAEVLLSPVKVVITIPPSEKAYFNGNYPRAYLKRKGIAQLLDEKEGIIIL